MHHGEWGSTRSFETQGTQGGSWSTLGGRLPGVQALPRWHLPKLLPQKRRFVHVDVVDVEGEQSHGDCVSRRVVA